MKMIGGFKKDINNPLKEIQENTGKQCLLSKTPPEKVAQVRKDGELFCTSG